MKNQIFTLTYPWDETLDQNGYKPEVTFELGMNEIGFTMDITTLESNPKREKTEHLQFVHEDSCVEWFVNFLPEKCDRYFNFEINPNGCLYIGFGHGRQDSTTLYRENMKELFDIRPQKTQDGWEVFYRIPLSFLRLFVPDFTFTGALHANVYKCGDLTEHRHFLSWNPVTSETPDFHRPQDFGLMLFE